MHLSIQRLLLGDTSLVVIVFFLCGGIIYLIDYIPAKTDGVSPYELHFKRMAAYGYMIGGLAAFLALRFAGWFAA